MLDSSDPHRVIRLVTRRCQLNLVEIQGRRVVVHFWGQQGQGDLRPFFKKHGLARKGVQVTLVERKREVSKIQSGDEFLYGDRLFPFWALKVCGVDAYRKKWERRFVEESNDWRAAPWSTSNYCWEGVEKRQIPWRVLKSAWCHEAAPLCAELRPAHDADLVRLLRVWLLQEMPCGHSHLPPLQPPVRGPLAVGWAEMDDGESG